MMFRNFSLLVLSFTAPSGAQFVTYRADLTELGGSGVSGTAIISDGSDGTTVGYAGFASGLQTSLIAASCTATNGCGVHIHGGTSCAGPDAQGGHYFDDPVTSDPWTMEQYMSDSSGAGTFAGVVEIGTDDLEGRAFIIHAADGSRVGCGLLTRVAEAVLLSADQAPLASSSVTGEVTVYEIGTRVCFFGTGFQLETDLDSEELVLVGEQDCSANNGCGAHIHAGTACTDSDTQGGHFYDSDTLMADPWQNTGYKSTNNVGTGFYVDCVVTGETEFTNKPFIVHANDGSRVACRLLEDCETVNECNSLFGTGGTMHVNVPLFDNRCFSRCVPDFFVGLKKIFGFECGDCPSN